MEKTYWLERKATSQRAAKSANSAVARLIHYDLAGRYSVKARSAETAVLDLSLSFSQPLNADETGNIDTATRHA